MKELSKRSLLIGVTVALLIGVGALAQGGALSKQGTSGPQEFARANPDITGPPFLPSDQGKEVVTGFFRCNLEDCEPCGPPFPRIGVETTIRGPMLLSQEYGLDRNLEEESGSAQACENWTENVHGMLQALGCTTGPIETHSWSYPDHVGQNWSANFVCHDSRDNVVNAMAELFERVILFSP